MSKNNYCTIKNPCLKPYKCWPVHILTPMQWSCKSMLSCWLSCLSVHLSVMLHLSVVLYVCLSLCEQFGHLVYNLAYKMMTFYTASIGHSLSYPVIYEWFLLSLFGDMTNYFIRIYSAGISHFALGIFINISDYCILRHKCHQWIISTYWKLKLKIHCAWSGHV